MRRDERGSMTLWVIGLTAVALALSGMCIDGWRMIATERSLATAVDAAAAAGANGIDEAAYRSSGVVRLDPARAEALAADTLSQQPGYAAMDGVDIAASADAVTVRASTTVQFTLTRILLTGGQQVSATADAQPRRSSG